VPDQKEKEWISVEKCNCQNAQRHINHSKGNIKLKKNYIFHNKIWQIIISEIMGS
jgi:hypothetical protein